MQDDETIQAQSEVARPQEKVTDFIDGWKSNATLRCDGQVSLSGMCSPAVVWERATTQTFAVIFYCSAVRREDAAQLVTTELVALAWRIKPATVRTEDYWQECAILAD